MINGGNASVYVSSMEVSIEFYTSKLGLILKNRVGETWAELDAGNGLIIGLHPASEQSVSPGTTGAINIELAVSEPLVDVVDVLKKRDVKLNGAILEYDAVHIASISDPDNNVILLAQIIHS